MHEDEDDSVESYDPDDDSDLMRSDVSDNVESEDDRDWRLTTNEVPRDRPVTVREIITIHDVTHKMPE